MRLVSTAEDRRDRIEPAPGMSVVSDSLSDIGALRVEASSSSSLSESLSFSGCVGQVTASVLARPDGPCWEAGFVLKQAFYEILLVASSFQVGRRVNNDIPIH